MRIKYSPCKHDHDTSIRVIDGNTLQIDGKPYEFPSDAVTFPDIAIQTGGAILEAHREGGELYLTVLRFYSGSCTEWDTGAYQEVTP